MVEAFHHAVKDRRDEAVLALHRLLDNQSRHSRDGPFRSSRSWTRCAGRRPSGAPAKLADEAR
jgi:hypothetical protein